MEPIEQSQVFLPQLDAPEGLLPAAQENAFAYPPLTQDQETFCLAVVECAGNISKAYRMAFGPDASMPLARGQALLVLPQIALKIKAITDAIEDASLISVGAHLNVLAEIRDLSMARGELKVAYLSERARGEAVGIYQKHDKGNKGGGNNVQVNVTMVSEHDRNI